ncbi:hypothetical protein [Pseudomonas asplenii]|uniref:hypothetical protein n=1 Tax=Pseudomonas asplenii TaxID=53407 RepID=UPI000377AAFC
MKGSEWSGVLWLGRDGALIHGELGPTAPHAHYAHLVILAPGAPVTLGLDDQAMDNVPPAITSRTGS